MTRLGFSKTLYLLMTLLVAVAVVVGAIGLSGIRQTNTGLETVYADRVVPLEQLKAISDAYAVSVIDAVNKANAGLMDAHEARESMASAQAVITDKWSAYRATKLTEEEARLATEAEARFGAANQSIDAVMARLSAMSGSVQGQLGAFDGPLYATIDPIGGTLTALIDLQLRVAREEYEAAQARYQRVMWLSLLSLVVGVMVAGGLGWLVVRGISRTLRSAAGELRVGSDQVVAASSQVSSSAQALSQGATEQAAALEQTSASMEEMSSMTRRNSTNAGEAATLMASVDRQVAESNRALDAMVVAMDRIAESSGKVSKIIKTIDEIAFQTNILALNAAVEAARAGEAGMGFAVVADEVRNLAQRSAQAARDTTALIEESMSNAQVGHERVTQVTGAITGIGESVGRVSLLVREVSEASRQQTEGIDQVARAIAEMEKVTQTTAATAEESAAASEELNAQAESAKAVVARLDAIVEGAAATSRVGQTERRSAQVVPMTRRGGPAGVAAPDAAVFRGGLRGAADSHSADAATGTYGTF